MKIIYDWGLHNMRIVSKGCSIRKVEKYYSKSQTALGEDRCQTVFSIRYGHYTHDITATVASYYDLYQIKLVSTLIWMEEGLMRPHS